MAKTAVIIMAGGQGKRATEGILPKQFQCVAGKPLFIHCLELYEQLGEVDEICLALNPNFLGEGIDMVKKQDIKKLRCIVPGGKVRQNSLYNAFEKVKSADLIVIHNAVSPNVSARFIKDCINVAKKKKVATAYFPAYHTVIEKGSTKIKQVFKRKTIGYICDPLVFQTKVLRDVLKKAGRNQKKDVSIIETTAELGYAIKLVESDAENIKVTFPFDLNALEHILRNKGKK